MASPWHPSSPQKKRTMTTRNVLLYGCKVYPLCIEAARRLSVLQRRCLWSITRILWEYRVNNDEVRPRVGCRQSPSDWGNRSLLPSVIHTCFVYACPSSIFSFPLARTGRGWKKRYGKQAELVHKHKEVSVGSAFGWYASSSWLGPKR